MNHRHVFRALAVVGLTVLAAACDDFADTTAPATPLPADAAALVAVTCTASIETRAVSCSTPHRLGGKTGSGLADEARALILGGQNEYVTLTSSNIVVQPDTFAFDVTVTNLIAQQIGTTDGSSVDPAGVRVFFHTAPVAAGGGTVTVAEPDGYDTFTAGAQPYYAYPTMLAQGETSNARTWKLHYTPEVTSFTFQVYVSAAVRYPDGYVDGHYYVRTLNPGESRALPATARRATGVALPGETVSHISNAPATATVSGSTVTAGGSRGFAEITVSAGARPGVYTTAISVCEATVVGSGTNLPSSISGTDCFSSYGSNNGRPTTSYYADLYRVTLTAGQTITVTMDSGDDLDTYLLLASPSLGTLVAGNDDDDEGTLGVGSRLVYTATESGVFVIEASTFNGLDTGNYTLTVNIS